MTGVRMKFGFDDMALKRELNRLEKAGEDFEPFLKRIGEEYAGAGGIIDQRFKDQKGPDGEAWQPLSAKYTRRRLKKYPNSDLMILSMSGNLRRSINYQISDSDLRIGTGGDVEHYAGVHQFGFTGGEGNQDIPARPYLGFADEDWDIIEEEALDHFMPK